VPLSLSVLKGRVENLDVLHRIRSHRNLFEGSLFLVGGALRELALGKEPRDYDFALEKVSDLAHLEEIFNSKSFVLGKKPIQTHRLVKSDLELDITILSSGISQDLLRRDFTVNAMAYDVGRGKIIDPLDGLGDVEQRIIKYPAPDSVREDPLRMVKAMRHLATLRGFALSAELRSAIRSNAKLIHQTAPERIKYEVDLIMLSQNPHKGLKTMYQTGLLFEIFPELIPMREMDIEKGFDLEAFGHTLEGYKYVARPRKLYDLSEGETKQTGYALLFHDLGKPYTFSYDEGKGQVHFFYHERHSREIATKIMERLRFSSAEAKSIQNLIENHMRIFLISHQDATDKATRRLVYKIGDLTPVLVSLTILDLYGSTKGKQNPSTANVLDRCRQVLEAYEEWKKEPLPTLVTGRDLLTLGFAEGPHLGAVLREIREKQIAGELTDKDEALEYAETRRLDSGSIG
jgi:tRNA nucleotidyltransferase/poly(A) polymerase